MPKRGWSAFLASGAHGDMIWMAPPPRGAAIRAALAAGPLDRDAGMNYGPEHDPLAILQERSHGAILDLCAEHSDYHDVIKRAAEDAGALAGRAGRRRRQSVSSIPRP